MSNTKDKCGTSAIPHVYKSIVFSRKAVNRNLLARLQNLAEKDGRSFNDYILEALIQHVEAVEGK